MLSHTRKLWFAKMEKAVLKETISQNQLVSKMGKAGCKGFSAIDTEEKHWNTTILLWNTK